MKTCVCMCSKIKDIKIITHDSLEKNNFAAKSNLAYATEARDKILYYSTSVQ